jgi:hypothetical protein
MARILPRTLGFLGLLLLVLASPAGAANDPAPALRQFAQHVGLTDVDGFVAAIETLRETHHLPPRYVTKRTAERLGWHPGRDLCRVAAGDEIGGDRFYDRQHRLPRASDRRWREADLDEHCGRRGAHRLIWSNDGFYFVTVDHYRSFVPVP